MILPLALILFSPVYSILGLLILILDIIAIISVIQTSLDPVMKLVWILLILFIPPIGMILYFLIGQKKL